MNPTDGKILDHLRRSMAPKALRAVADADLLTAFADHHDQGAFATVVARHGPMVLNVCRRVLGHAQAAEDAFQAVFLVLARKASSVRRRESLASWLYGVAYRVARKARRASGPICRPLPEAQGPPDPHPDPLEELSARELLAALEEEIQKLPKAYRVAVALCCLDGLGHNEAAERIGCTEDALRGRLERGRKRLHARLVRRGLTLSAALGVQEAVRGMLWAKVPAGLLHQTVESAVHFVTTNTALVAGSSAEAISLAKAVLKGTAMLKLKLVLAGAFLMSVTALGAGGLVNLDTAGGTSANGPEGPKQLAAAPPQTQPKLKQETPRADLYGDPLPEGVLARLGTVRLRHRQTALGVAFSPDGKVLATSANDDAIRLWESGTGKPVRELINNNGEGVFAVAFSPDGSKLAAVGERGTVYLWDLAAGKVLNENKVPQGRVCNVAFASDGLTFASGGEDGFIRTWKVATGNEVATLEAGKKAGDGQPLAYSRDGKLLASALGQTIRLWNLATNVPLHTIEKAHDQNVTSLAFADDGKTLISGGANYLNVTKDGRNAWRVMPEIVVWDVLSGKRLRELKEDSPEGWCGITVSRDGKTLAALHGDRIRIWDVRAGKPICEIRDLNYPYVPRGNELAFSPDGKALAAVIADHDVRLWEVATGKPLLSFPETHHWRVDFVAQTRSGLAVTSGTGDGTVRLWDSTTTRQLQQLSIGTGQSAWVWATAVSPDAKAVAAAGIAPRIMSSPAFLKLWNAESGQEVFSKELDGQPNALAFAPGGKVLALAGGRRDEKGELRTNLVMLMDPTNGKELARLGGHAGEISALAFTPDGKCLYSFGGDRIVVVWELITKSERSRFRLPGQEMPNFVAFAPDGRFLATCERGSNTIFIYELPTGREFRRFLVGNNRGNVLAFSPDGRTLAAADLSTKGGPRQDPFHLRLWEICSGQKLTTFQSKVSSFRSLAFSFDGRTLISGMDDGTALIWDVTGSPTRELHVGKTEQLWDALAGNDPGDAYQAAWMLATTPDPAVKLLGERLTPAAPADAKVLEKLIAALDSADFKVRQQATAELERLAELALPTLRKLLEGNPNLEVRRRVEAVVKNVTGPITVAERLRIVRAVAVLEQVGSLAAKQVLQRLAAGAPEALITQEAKASLARLAVGEYKTP